MPKVFFILLFLFSTSGIAQQFDNEGKASFYADRFEGQLTANGEIFTQSELTAAHKTLPFGTLLRVTNTTNGKSVIVRVNDRGPFVDGRIIDLSKSAAKSLDFIKLGVVDVIVEVLPENEIEIIDLVKKIETPEKNKTEFWKLETKRLSPIGFAVQVGSFETTSNLIRLVDKLQHNYRKKITVKIKNEQETSIYSILIGIFPDREKAEKFQQKISQNYPGSFVVDFSKF